MDKKAFRFLCLFIIPAFIFADPISLTKRERDQLKKETVYAIDLIQRYHLKQTSFADIDPKELLLAYIEDLDSTHLFLIQDDVDFIIDRFASSLKPSYLYVGDLFPAFEIFNIYEKRVQERLDWIDQRLNEPFDLNSDMTFVPDRSDADWPANQAEADDLWEKRLTNELISERLENEPMDRTLKTIRKRYDRMHKYLSEIDVHNVQETFLTSLAQLYDPHSNFFSWDSAQEFDIQISNALVGIGAQLRDIDGYCVVERLIPGGPAEMSGKFHPGDKIVAVGQGDGEPVDVIGMKLRKIVQMIRGEEGSEVQLTLESPTSGKRRVITLVREKVELTANLANAELFELPDTENPDKTVKIGVIALPSFYGEGEFGEDSISTSKDIAELISKLKEEKVEGIVLDLRNNGGGRLDEAIKLTGLFIPEGPVVLKRNSNGSIEEDWDRDKSIAWTGPLAVLVSRSSASASEIVAGALQADGRAIVIGDESTHGKGTVQAPIDLRAAMRRLPFSEALEVGTIKITVQQFYLPNGDSTQNRGVVSDIPLQSANMFLFEGEADLDNALEWDHINPVEFDLPKMVEGKPLALVSDDLMKNLKNRSLERQKELEEFSFLNQNVAWFKERHDMKEVPLNLEKRRTLKNEVEQKRDEFEDQINRMSKELSFKAHKVDLNITNAKEVAHQQKLTSIPLPGGINRSNQFYQKVFYYQKSPEDKIHEIWVEYFDYDKALDNASAFAEIIRKDADTEITNDQMKDILTRLKNADRISEFSITKPFELVLGDSFNEEKILSVMPAFFAKMVEIDPDVLLERSKLDIPLRESLRVVRDWIDLDSPVVKAEVAQKTDKHKVAPDQDDSESTTR